MLETYHPRALSSLVIGGDGASWVKSGTEVFEGSLYQLDRFHLRRALLRASGKMAALKSIYTLATRGNLKQMLLMLEKEGRQEPNKKGDVKKWLPILKATPLV